MNNSLYFKHFRKFKEFPNIEFGDITFLVGKNNSGKSTFVKAIFLIIDFLKSESVKIIDFNNKSTNILKLATYSRNLHHNANLKNKNNYIVLSFTTNSINFNIKLSSLSFETTKADIHEIIITDLTEHYTFKLLPISGKFIIETNSKFLKKEKKTKKLDKKEFNLLQNKFLYLQLMQKKINDKLSNEYIENLSMLNRLKRDIEIIQQTNNSNTIKQTDDGGFYLECYFKNENIESIFKEVIDTHLLKYKVEFRKNQNKTSLKKDSKAFENLRHLYHNQSYFKFISNKIFSTINNFSIVYLPAQLNKPSSLIPILSDTSSISQTFSNYIHSNIYQDSFSVSFINQWLRKFEIAQNIEIKSLDGEYVSVIINPEKNSVNLADMGMGSIQIINLIIKITSVIFDQKKIDKNSIVIIEEPEMNLHPQLQSLLCEMFHEIYKNYGIKFIIETHSEYLIRKSQLIVKNNEYEIEPNENPFSVLYFNDDLKVWKMEYREDGKFKNGFGSGFFDESSNLAFELM
ncbi:hypothetical protein CMU21_04830 [Elizabethkingia anophelis]|nr:hypothetical protein [Elizabethkingia anophelis]